MKYERQEIKCPNFFFSDDTFKLHLRPKLPTIEFKKGRRKYKVTDLRCLNEKAVDVFKDILKTVFSTPNCESVTYKVNGLEEDKRKLFSDILMGIEYEFKSYGHWGLGVFLVSGTTTTYKDNGDILMTFELCKENAEIIHDFAQEHSVVNYFDLVPVLVEGTHKRLESANEVSLDDIGNYVNA